MTWEHYYYLIFILSIIKIVSFIFKFDITLVPTNAQILRRISVKSGGLWIRIFCIIKGCRSIRQSHYVYSTLFIFFLKYYFLRLMNWIGNVPPHRIFIKMEWIIKFLIIFCFFFFIFFVVFYKLCRWLCILAHYIVI